MVRLLEHDFKSFREYMIKDATIFFKKEHPDLYYKNDFIEFIHLKLENIYQDLKNEKLLKSELVELKLHVKGRLNTEYRHSRYNYFNTLIQEHFDLDYQERIKYPDYQSELSYFINTKEVKAFLDKYEFGTQNFTYKDIMDIEAIELIKKWINQN